MKTRYFNTGVRAYHVTNFPFEYHKEQGHRIDANGVLSIPFDCEAPDNAKLMFLCNNPELPESKNDNVLVVSVSNTTMISKYAYFKVS